MVHDACVSYLALCVVVVVFTGAIPKGLILKKIRVCVYFVLCIFLSGLILWDLENLWFGDLCEE